MRGKIRPVNYRIPKPVTGTQGISIRHPLTWGACGEAIGRCGYAVKVTGATHYAAFYLRGIGDGEARAKHRLRCDLVGHSQVRSEGKWVSLGEVALARGLVFHRANSSPDQRVGKVEGGALLAAILLLPGDAVVPAKAVVEGQLARDFPTVLSVDSVGMVT